MIVNVNMCASMFDETFHVMKFSAIAKKVRILRLHNLLCLYLSADTSSENLDVCFIFPFISVILR